MKQIVGLVSLMRRCRWGLASALLAALVVAVLPVGQIRGGAMALRGYVGTYIDPPLTVISISFNPAQVLGGQPTVGTVTLSGLAPAAGAVVSLSADNYDAATPATVTVPSGQTQVTFVTGTAPVNTMESVNVVARYGDSTASTTLVLDVYRVVSVTLDPTEVMGGEKSHGVVILNGPAGPDGITVDLASDCQYAPVQGSVYIEANSDRASFEIAAGAPLTDQTAHITATLGATHASATLTILAQIGIESVTFDPPSVMSGNSAWAVVRFTRPITSYVRLVFSNPTPWLIQLPLEWDEFYGSREARIEVPTYDGATGTAVAGFQIVGYPASYTEASLSITPYVPGEGTWRISTRFVGTARVTGWPSDVVKANNIRAYLSNPERVATLDLAKVTNVPVSAESGGLTAQLNLSVRLLHSDANKYQPMDDWGGVASLQLSDNAAIAFELQWQPKSGNWTLDPAPREVCVYNDLHVIGYSSAATVGTWNDSNPYTKWGLQPYLGGNGIFVTAPVSGNQFIENADRRDLPWQMHLLGVYGGKASFAVPLDGGITSSYEWYGNMPHECQYDNKNYNELNFCSNLVVAGFDLSRFTDHTGFISGSNASLSSDPVFTRWLPLAFSPVVRSQQVGLAPDLSYKPWGNVNCAYSMAIYPDDDPQKQNFDQAAQGVFYLPAPWRDGTYNQPQATDRPMGSTAGSTHAAFLLDATGNRYDLYGDYAHLAAGPQLHSELVPAGAGYLLRNAGPPSAIGEVGHYTYTFASTPCSPRVLRLTAIQDEVGNVQNLFWTQAALTVADSTSGRALQFAYAPEGYVSSVTAPDNSHTDLLFYDGLLTYLRVYGAGSQTPDQVENYIYAPAPGDPYTRSVTEKHQGLTTTRYSYEASKWRYDVWSGDKIGRVSSVSLGADGDTSSSDDGLPIVGKWVMTSGVAELGYYHWGVDLRTNTVTDPRGNTTYIQYSLGDNPDDNTLTGKLRFTKVTGPEYYGAPAGSNVTVTQYQPSADNPSSINVTDPFGQVWFTSFDGQGHVASARVPGVGTLSTTYNELGQPTSFSDPSGLVLQLAYGENGAPPSRATTVKDASGAARLTTTYNAFGQVATVTVPQGASGGAETTRYEYQSAAGDLTKLINPLGDAVTVDQYDALGDPLVLSCYPATGQPGSGEPPVSTVVTYNAAQMPTSITDGSGVSLVVGYNNGVPTRYSRVFGGNELAFINLQYDSRGRVYRASDAVGTAVQYRYDRNGNMTRVIDGLGHAASASYGKNNELTGISWGGTGSTRFLYDAAGRLTSVTDERGRALNVGYDVTYRVQDLGDVHVDYNGRLVTGTRNSAASAVYNYDPTLKRLTSVVTTLGGRQYTNSYTYYPDGKLWTVTTPVGTTTYQYDAGGRVTSMTSPFSEVTTWGYDHADRVRSETTTTASTTLATTYSFGSTGLPGDTSTVPYYNNGVSQTINGQPFRAYVLTHSPLGQLLEQRVATNGITEDAAYTYDGRGRLASEQAAYALDSQHSGTVQGGYTYDLANNVNAASGWSYNTLDQVTYAPARGSLLGGSGFSYDASGNMTGLNGQTLAYDDFGRLSGFGSATYSYDFAGRRVAKRVGTQTTYYLYDGDSLIAEVNGSTGQITRSYQWGVTGLISDRANGASRYYLYDSSGNTRYLVSATGAVQELGAYGAWGVPMPGFSLSTPFAWNGRSGCYTDSESGLALMRARYYAPSLGRFVSRDPAGFGTGPNPYTYCVDDPIDLSDPTGLSASEVGDQMLLFGAGGFAADAWARLSVGKGSYGEVAWKSGVLAGATAASFLALRHVATVGLRGAGYLIGWLTRRAAAEEGAEAAAQVAGHVPRTIPKMPLDAHAWEQSPLSRVLAPGEGPGRYCYVRDTDGIVRVVPEGGHMHPKVLGYGRPATGAGELVIAEDGSIVVVDNVSGTFRFAPDSIDDVIESMRAQGMRVRGGAKSAFPWDEP